MVITHSRPPAVSRDCSLTAKERIDRAASSLVAAGHPLVLAVSGGIDSMVLLHAVGEAVASGGRDRVVVATFDHGTGPHAAHAVEQVQRSAERWGVRCVAGRTSVALRGESAWRAARWRFLRGIAAELRGCVATAHTLDDHVETIVMRVLRGAGARGLSAMRAPSQVRRPLLAIERVAIASYAEQEGVEWTDDPSNTDRAYLRNRVRLDLLPALRRACPTFDDELLSIADRAADMRLACVALVRPLVRSASDGRVVASCIADRDWGLDERALLCQTVAEFGGIALDWRGTDRLARFIVDGRIGSRIPLSGGFEAVLRRDEIEMRRATAVPDAVQLGPPWDARFGAWRFRRMPEPRPLDGSAPASLVAEPLGEGAGSAQDPWVAWLPADAVTVVRPWTDGDRMTSSGSGLRRVKRFLSDSRIAAADRAGWPVVVSDGEIVWIPGVRRASAASARPGRPRVCIVCERIQG